MNLRTLLIAAICIASGFNAPAQLLTNTNVLISITGSAQVTVKGDVLNNPGTTIANDATLDLTGDWINNSGSNCFGTSQGTVILNGTNQLIRGNTQTVFNNLTLTGGTKTLQISTTSGGGNGSPTGILACNDAVLDLNSNTLTVNNSACTAISNTTGYIISEDTDNSSKLTWNIGATGGLHVIPFGNTSGIQIPFSASVTAGNIGNVTVSTYKTIPNNTPYPVTPTLVSNVNNVSGSDNSANTVDRFWQVDRTGSGSATYTFTYASTENALNGNSNMRAQCWNNGLVGWETALIGQSNPTTQSVTVPGVAKSGAWTLTQLSNPLPIELISFTANAIQNNKVACNWVTASEENNDFFTVMRSKDGITFEDAGIVNGAGTSKAILQYEFTDPLPYKGVSYYRLKQTDFDGNFSYSKIVSVLITNGNRNYSVYPNPSEGQVIIKYNVEENTLATYTISDVSGKIVASGTLTNLSGEQQVSLTSVSKGLYFLRVNNGTSLFQSKLEVIR